LTAILDFCCCGNRGRKKRSSRRETLKEEKREKKKFGLGRKKEPWIKKHIQTGLADTHTVCWRLKLCECGFG